MMYTFPNKLRNLAFVFMAVGFVGLAYGFLTAPTTIEQAKDLVAANHGEGHGTSHKNLGTHDGTDFHVEKSNHTTNHDDNIHADVTHDELHNIEHDEHVFHQLNNKPWAALYVAAFFFFMISLGVLAFYAIPVSYTHLTLPTKRIV